ncbi:hypothetical protein FEM48_Zijuj02G0009400 [Ziziphus jujuba var. spinosa]|uniref:Bulb-type lectin domain-containing protein n=1 Tax=Ziziphus jujuba var. spinosa TaxID=714518 RepID=A0A978VSN7_ZIZJJ|nr:hypothetical protein FEM48_Zijuj02G0009400 [Ziziphus jujuba var. spinosa]
MAAARDTDAGRSLADSTAALLCSSLSVEKQNDVLVSPNGVFSAGFSSVGDNAFCFAIRFMKSSVPTIVWMANRDQPVNGKASKLSLLRNGNLILLDAGRIPLWSSETTSPISVYLQLRDNGPDPQISSVYWPEPIMLTFEAGRTTYNNSKTAMFDSTGYFRSSDDLVFSASDCGVVLYRRLTVDPDGNVRFYSFDEKSKVWVITWQAISQPCRIHGICGPNSLCEYDHALGRRCLCLPGFKMKKYLDWSYGCEPVDFNYNSFFNISQETGFIHLTNTEFYGYDKDYIQNCTLQRCQEECLKSSQCKAIQFKYIRSEGRYDCYTKPHLLNGQQQPGFRGDMYVRLPKSILSSIDEKPMKELKLDCPHQEHVPLLLNRTYVKESPNGFQKFLLLFAVSLGGVEFVCISLVLRKKPAGSQFSESGMMTENHGRLVKWVKKKMIGADTSQTNCIEEIADSKMGGKFDKAKLEVLVKVALQCVEEDKEARPTMRQVVEMLQGHEEEKFFCTPRVPDPPCESGLPYFDNIESFLDADEHSSIH